MVASKDIDAIASRLITRLNNEPAIDIFADPDYQWLRSNLIDLLTGLANRYGHHVERSELYDRALKYSLRTYGTDSGIRHFVTHITAYMRYYD
jgi:hypothetical protein